MKKKRLFLLPCIAAVAIATFVGTKTFMSDASESNALLIANVEALSQSGDGNNDNPKKQDCWNTITTEKGSTVWYCPECAELPGKKVGINLSYCWLYYAY